MPYYLAPYIGTGQSGDPFRPRGSDQSGWSAIDLRPDGGATLDGGGLNACLLHLPIHDSDAQLGHVALDQADMVGPGLARSIAARLKLLDDPVSTRWDDLVMELLLGPPPGGWKPLHATVDGAYDVWLGGLLRRLPVVRGGASISENWNCANQAGSLTCQLTWDDRAEGNWGIVTNRAQDSASDGSFRVAQAASNLATADHQAQATIITNTIGIAGFVGVTVRHHATTVNRYQWYSRKNDAPADDHVLAKFVADVETTLGTAADDFVSGEVLKLDCNGSTITGYIGGVSKVSATDTAVTGNLRCGVIGHIGGVSTVALDDWSAADLAAGAAAPPQRMLLGVGV